MKIVTGAAPYIDIDAYAAIIAYSELLQNLGVPAVAVSSSELNESITKEILEWEVEFLRDYSVDSDDEFSIMDVSDPKQFDALVTLDKVVEIVDHHPGFEEYWTEKIGAGLHIERIGAACTLVYERWEKAGLLNQMKPKTASLLISGLLDNTLNFLASVTTGRDKKAYKELSLIADISDDWPEKYFSECSKSILSDFPKSLRNDTKIINFKTYENDLAVGQVVVWDGFGLASTNKVDIEKVLSGMMKNWFVNIVSIEEGVSRFIVSDTGVRDWLGKLLDVSFVDGVATANRLWLRKEILMVDIDVKNKEKEK